jgi:hypothetical protein
MRECKTHGFQINLAINIVHPLDFQEKTALANFKILVIFKPLWQSTAAR